MVRSALEASPSDIRRNEHMLHPTAMTETPPPRRNPFAGAGAGYLPLGGAIVGFGGGYLIDQAAGTRPVWTLVLGILFMAVGVYHMIKEARR